MIKKRIVSGLAALVLTAGAAAVPIGESGAQLFVPEISASAATSIDINDFTYKDLEEFAKKATTKQLIKYIEDNHIVASWSKMEDGSYFFEFCHYIDSDGKGIESAKVVLFEEISDKEYLWYVVKDNKAYIVGYFGVNTKKELAIPEKIAGKKVAGMGAYSEVAYFHKDKSFEVAGYGGGAGFCPNGLTGLYIPKHVKKITAYDEEDILWGRDVKLYVNKDSYAYKYAKNRGLSYTVVPDNYTFKTPINKTTIKLAKTKVAYTGKAQVVGVSVKNGSTKLKKGTDYTLTFKNNKTTGKATVTIKGKGKYTGSVKKSFIIVPKKQTSSVKALGSKKIKVTVKKTKLATGYQIQCSTSKKFTKATTTTVDLAKYTKNVKTFTKLKKGKTYYVRSRSYIKVGTKKYYGAFSAIKNIKCK